MNCRGDDDVDANGRDRRSGKPVKCHARKERALLVGTRSANHIRASGHNGCTQRPDTWLHPNASRKTSDSPCTAGAVHTWHFSAVPAVPTNVVQCRYASEVAARSVKAVDKPILDGVGPRQEDDRNCHGRCLCGHRGINVAASCDHAHPTANQIGRQRRQPVVPTVGPAV